MSDEASAFVPGIHSQVGRSTAFEIDHLQAKVDAFDKGPQALPDHEKTSQVSKKSETHSKASAGDSPEGMHPRTPGGALAQALHQKLSSTVEEVVGPEVTTTDAPRLTSSFSCQGKDGQWATKFTAMGDLRAFGRRDLEKDHPDVNWYKVKHESVLHRPPAWPIGATSKPMPKPKNSDSSSMSFLTGIDEEETEKTEKPAMTARQRARALLEQAGLQEELKQKGTYMSLATERGDLGKVGRNHVLGNEISNAYDSDLLEQDIKGYPKLRYPRWDFDAYSSRPPLIPTDALSEPGKYGYVNLDCVKPVPKQFADFGQRLPRSQFVGFMGYIAPPAVLWPEDKRTRGQLPDRSLAKDRVRHRVTHVNDFDRESARPPLLTDAATTYYDEKDPAACEAVYRREYSYDVNIADVSSTHRRDVTVDYSRMSGRGQAAVQGVRALSSDLGVRGAVGLGFIETHHQRHSTIEQIEGKGINGAHQNPSIGLIRMDSTSLNQHTDWSERVFRGKHPVKGFGPSKHAPLKRKDNPIRIGAFKRSASAPGFQARSKFGGTRDVFGKNRVSIPDPGWSPAELDSMQNSCIPC